MGVDTVATFVATVDDDLNVRTRLAMQVGDRPDASAFPTVEAVDTVLAVGVPAVVVFGPSFGDEWGLARIEGITQNRPEVAAILVVETLTTALLQQALRVGVRDVLTAPVEGEQLAEAIDRVAATLVAAAPAVPVVPAPTEPAGPRGRLITVFSPKGGTGKTVLATNLAVALTRGGGTVALVDADLQFGDVAVMLKLTPQHTIVDAVTAIERLDSQFLNQLLVRHEPSGVMVLPAPIEPAFADQVSASDMSRIIATLRSTFTHVIVDTPSYFNEVVLSLLEESDDILLVAGMDVPNIKNVKIGLQTLRLLNTPVHKVKLVLNRANSRVKLDVAEVEKTLQVKADCLVPSDVVVPQSVNKGIPVVLDAPRSGVAKSIEQLATLFQGAGVGRR